MHVFITMLLYLVSPTAQNLIYEKPYASGKVKEIVQPTSFLYVIKQ